MQLFKVGYKNDVVLTSMRRDCVASTSIRRHFGKCPLGIILTCLDTLSDVPCTLLKRHKCLSITIDRSTHLTHFNQWMRPFLTLE